MQRIVGKILAKLRRLDADQAIERVIGVMRVALDDGIAVPVIFEMRDVFIEIVEPRELSRQSKR